MIKLQNVSKSYSKGSVKAVDNINLDVKSGEIFGFLGPNGAGKTTTIKMIVGILKQDSGNITIDGIDTIDNPIEAKMKFSYVPDSPELYDKLTGIDYLNFLSDIYKVSKEDRIDRIKKYSSLFEIENSLGDFIESYSHGMKQKLALVGALVHEPDIFILDEPMVGLDPKSAFNLKKHMRERCENGKTVFFSTHVMEVAEKICDRIAIISKGKIIAVGTIEELRNMADDETSLENIFLELTEND